MKILWFSHFMPFPPAGGNRQRSFNLIRQVAKVHEVSLIAFNLDAQPDAVLQQYKSELLKYCSEVEFWKLPVRWRGPLWWARLSLSPFSSFPYSCDSFYSEMLATQFRHKLENEKFDLVHFDSPDLARYFDLARGPARAVNHHNCESAMLRRRAELNSNPLSKLFLSLQAKKFVAVEAEICSQAQVNLVVSESDGELLKSSSPNAYIQVVENGTDTDFFQPATQAVEPNTLIFAGSLDWYPNVSGLQFFIEKIWPLVKQQNSQAKLYLAGRNPSRSVRAWAESDSQIIVVPSPDDIRPWIARAAVFICPILDGGGTRLKLLDAMAMGKAIVTTTIGREGLAVENGKHMIVAADPKQFAQAINSLFESDELRQSLRRAGREFVQRHSWEHMGTELLKAYSSVWPKTIDYSRERSGNPKSTKKQLSR